MIQKVLVGTDTSASADLAVEVAAGLAARHEAELLVLYVRGERPVGGAADPKKAADPDGYLARMTARFPELKVRSWSESGDPAEHLCEVAAAERVDTIVVGNKGVDGSRWRVPRRCRRWWFATRRARCSSSTPGKRSSASWLRARTRGRP
jgi:nucleotide-binding universal stress UspA family protein